MDFSNPLGFKSSISARKSDSSMVAWVDPSIFNSVYHKKEEGRGQAYMESEWGGRV